MNNEKLILKSELFIIESNLKAITEKTELNKSSEIILMFGIVECITRLSKNYKLDSKMYNKINVFRQKFAHSGIPMTLIFEELSSYYYDIYNYLISYENLEDLFVNKKPNVEYEYIIDSEINKFLDKNKYNNQEYRFFRLKDVPGGKKFDVERNYLLVTDFNNENFFKTLREELFEEFSNLVNLRRIYELPYNPKETGLTEILWGIW